MKIIYRVMKLVIYGHLKTLKKCVKFQSYGRNIFFRYEKLYVKSGQKPELNKKP